jgi:hypothetical protein
MFPNGRQNRPSTNETIKKRPETVKLRLLKNGRKCLKASGKIEKAYFTGF